MDGLGDLFGSIGEMLSGLGEGAGEVASSAVFGALTGGDGDGGGTVVRTGALDRYLCGGPRRLNVNDI